MVEEAKRLCRIYGFKLEENGDWDWCELHVFGSKEKRIGGKEITISVRDGEGYDCRGVQVREGRPRGAHGSWSLLVAHQNEILNCFCVSDLQSSRD